MNPTAPETDPAVAPGAAARLSVRDGSGLSSIIRSVRTRIAWAVSAYVVVTLGILAVLLLQIRADFLVSGERLIASFAQITAEQTAGTIQNVEQTLQVVDGILAREELAPLSNGSVASELRTLMRDRPFLKGLGVVDADGRVFVTASSANLGVDLSSRDFFVRRKADPALGFELDVPVRSELVRDWIIPATRTWKNGAGAFAGVIVAALDPRYLDRVWSLDGPRQDIVIGLFRSDGTMLMRSPFADEAMGTVMPDAPAFRAVAAGGRDGVYQNRSVVDGMMRLLGYRRLAGDSSLVVVVGQGIDRLLAPWWHIVGVVALGWILASAGLAALAYWLAAEWSRRLATDARYRELFEANPDPMAVFDRDTMRYLAVNEAMVRQYGWSREEFLTMTPAELRAPEDMHMLHDALADDSPGARTIYGRHRRKDGSLVDVEVRFAAIEFEGRPAFLPMARDITERNRIERAHRVAEEKLRQLQKMEAVGQLTGGVAHDFNNILMVMMANTDALEDDYELSPAVREHVENIARATGRAADLTRQLLAFSRKQPLRPQVTDINDLVVATGRLLRRTLGEHVVVESALADDPWLVNVDRAQLETALVNLCVNARDAMPGGGRLLIETRNAVLDEAAAARHADAVAGAYALLAVTDTGVGIPPDNLDKVFEPFFTTKDVGRGTGLGLSMVYGFIRQSNGHIRIDSAPGRGTTVTLYLPRSEGEREPAIETARQVPRGSERILVVEDDAQVRLNVVQQLRGLGYEVDEAGDGAAGLAACATAAAPYDLVLTDVIMPGPLGGKGLADEVARRWPATPVVFMSGYTEDAIARDGRLEPGVRLLNKPFRRRDLARFVREALGDGVGSEVATP